VRRGADDIDGDPSAAGIDLAHEDTVHEGAEVAVLRPGIGVTPGRGMNRYAR
jgi:hypothetical protein